jgi:hypothetical protein
LAWLKKENLPYVSICQSQQTFAALFAKNVKRPDFFLLFESLGLIAIDVKNYGLPGESRYTLNLDRELRTSVAFERLFRIPVWYAYHDDASSWYWISALKAIEVGGRPEHGRNGEYLSIGRDQFAHITKREDLSKLYTHFLPSTSGLAQLPLQSNPGRQDVRANL